jgi:hypothetical protein
MMQVNIKWEIVATRRKILRSLQTGCHVRNCVLADSGQSA